MDKNTLSNYGWIVIAVLVLSVMIALATPFGEYIKAGVESTTTGLFETGEKAMNVVGMSAGDGSFESGSGSSTPEYDHNAPELHPNDGTTPQNNDTYNYGDYTYTYSTVLGGWKVDVIDTTKTEYGLILESINGQPVTSMQGTFSQCYSLTKIPMIPNNITNMSYAFYYCESLKDISGLVVPNTVTTIEKMFSYCKSLTNVDDLVIPNGVTSLSLTFEGSGIVDASGLVIPNSVTNMKRAFQDCKSLSVAPVIPNTIINLQETFSGCKSLIVAPDLNNCTELTNMNSAFNNCTSLTTVPKIPNSVTDMNGTFAGCTSLTGTITIDANPTTYNICFSRVDFTAQNLTLAGTSPKLSQIGATGTNYQG